MSPVEKKIYYYYFSFCADHGRKQLIGREEGRRDVVPSPVVAYAALQTGPSLFLSHCTARETQTCDVSVRSANAHIFPKYFFDNYTNVKWPKPKRQKINMRSSRTSWPAVFPLPCRRLPSRPSSASSSSCKCKPRPHRSPLTNNTKVWNDIIFFTRFFFFF